MEASADKTSARSAMPIAEAGSQVDKTQKTVGLVLSQAAQSLRKLRHGRWPCDL